LNRGDRFGAQGLGQFDGVGHSLLLPISLSEWRDGMAGCLEDGSAN
jgi:hypothetical protein